VAWGGGEGGVLGGARMRIAFFAQLDVAREGGVFRKVRKQLRAWQALGHEVRLFALSEGEGVAAEAGDLPVTAVRRGVGWGRWRSSEALGGAMRRWRPDVLIARFGFKYPALLRLAAEFPLVVEANTLDLVEFRRTTSRWSFGAYRLMRPWLLARVAGLVAVTPEIEASFAGARFPRVVIPNAVDLSGTVPLGAGSGARRVVMLSDGAAPWHGIDRVHALAARMPGVAFEVVGVPDGKGGAGNVTHVPFLNAAGVRSRLAAAAVGLGPFGLSVSGLREAAPLKVREYLAHGLAVALPYRDVDFGVASPFVHALPHRVDEVDVAAFERFVAAWSVARVDRRLLRGVSVEEREGERLAFVAEVVQRWRRG
jgi:hypothetical protein